MPKPKEPEHWTVGVWRDMPRYQCAYCPWDTLDLSRMEQHYAERHAPMPPRPAKPIVVTDRYGNVVRKDGE